MEPIIDKPELYFLKLNNSLTINKKLTFDMLKSKNEISLCFDLSNLPNNKILCVYWRFHNFYSEIKGIQTQNSPFGYKSPDVFTVIEPFHQLPNLINDTVEKRNHIYMQSFCFHCMETTKNTGYISTDKFEMLVLTYNDVQLNDESTIELVVQYSVALQDDC